MRDCKKKVRKIEVYNESKKSVNKNAYCLKILWYRSFGIADNFLKENAQDELLGVLAHEIGHLKHKKDILDYLNYLPLVLMSVALFFLLGNLDSFSKLIALPVKGINQAFGIEVCNYYLLFIYISYLLFPLSLFNSIHGNYVSRRNEYEADGNAVKEGYGNALIATFTKMSSDELIDINPARIIEILDYDHPGMINRIKAIRKKM